MTITAAPVKTASEVVWDAYDLLQKRGWVQRTSEDAAFRHCLGGAVECSAWEVETYNNLHMVANQDPRVDAIDALTRAAREEVNKTIKSMYGQNWYIERWNDAQGRTQAEVEDVLFKTAMRLEDEGR
jgi:hypothetical protein